MLKLFKAQGKFKGDLTPVQRIALQLSMIAKEEDMLTTISNAVKSVQSFINPKAYMQIYKTSENEYERLESTSEEVGMSVDISSIEDIDKYMEYAFKQSQINNTNVIGSNKELQLNL